MRYPNFVICKSMILKWSFFFKLNEIKLMVNVRMNKIIDDIDSVSNEQQIFVEKSLISWLK